MGLGSSVVRVLGLATHARLAPQSFFGSSLHAVSWASQPEEMGINTRTIRKKDRYSAHHSCNRALKSSHPVDLPFLGFELGFSRDR